MFREAAPLAQPLPVVTLRNISAVVTTLPFRDPYTATSDGLRAIIAKGHSPVLQFNAPPEGDVLERMNALCQEFGADLQIRFYMFRWQEFDTSVLRRLPDVASLSIDSIRAISDFAPVAALPKLTRLRFGVHEHPNGEFLKQLDLARFTHLTIAENNRRNFDLSPLAAATSLEHLFVQGHDRGIGAIARLPKLCKVSLSGFPKRHDLAFLNDLSPLRSLFLILGSRRTIAEFTHPALRELKITWVRLLEDLGPLTRFEKLETLAIEDQLRLTSIDVRGLKLRQLSIANCKNLTSLEPIESLRTLERFYFRDTKLPAEYRQFIRLPEPKR